MAHAEIVSKDGRRRKAQPGEVLADNERIVMRVQDAKGKWFDMAFNAAGQPVQGADALARHKPGFRAIADTATVERAEGARLARKAQLSDMWKAGR